MSLQSGVQGHAAIVIAAATWGSNVRRSATKEPRRSSPDDPPRRPGLTYGRFRDQLLNLWHFDSLLEARVVIEDHCIDYNLNRQHIARGDLTPTEFVSGLVMPELMIEIKVIAAV